MRAGGNPRDGCRRVCGDGVCAQGQGYRRPRQRAASLREQAMIRTEALLESPDGFKAWPGGGSLSPAQRAAARVMDGLPLGDLATDADALALVGGAEALARLPSEKGVMPTE